MEIIWNIWEITRIVEDELWDWASLDEALIFKANGLDQEKNSLQNQCSVNSFNISETSKTIAIIKINDGKRRSIISRVQWLLECSCDWLTLK